jgi:hypothetical protein
MVIVSHCGICFCAMAIKSSWLSGDVPGGGVGISTAGWVEN